MKARPAKAPRIPPYPGLAVEADEVVWDGRFPVQRVRFTYARFDGTRSAPLTWELWRRGPAVAMLPYDPRRDRVALIEQFRLPALAAGQPPILREAPAGLIEPGEDPEAAGRREVREETGLTLGRTESLGDYLLMQGGCDETIALYVAEADLPEAAAGATHGLAAEGEDIRLLILPAEDAFALIEAQTLRNATAALCLMWLRHHRARLREEWR
jgi:ADP-ribose pyrophosphatase